MDEPIDRVLALLDGVKRHGSYWTARCPTRDDRNPSLSITVAEDGRVLLKDHGGDTTEAIVAALGLTMSDLFRDRRGNTVNSNPVRARKPKPRVKPVVPAGASFQEGAKRWFAERGISAETMAHYGVYTEAAHYFHKADGETSAICIPYLRNGEVVNIKYRSSKVKDFAMPADAEACFFNLDNQAGQADIIIVEGEMDVLAIYEATGREAISPPAGCQSITEEVMQSAATLLGDATRRVILAGDDDEKGREMMDALAHRIGRERCFRVRWPDGCKDANEVLIRNREAVGEALDHPEPYMVVGIVSVHDNSEDYWTLYDGGLPSGISTGIPALDKIYTVAPGQFTVTTGIPNAGKTTIIDNLLVNIGKGNDWTFGVCSMENRRLARHQAGIAQKYIGKPFREGVGERMSIEEASAAEDWLAEHVSFIKTPDPTIEAILSVSRALVYRTGIKGLVIDPWNRIHHPQSMNSGDYVADALNQISEFADRFAVHVWLVAHPTKVQKNISTGEYPILDGYDISGSAHFNNMADYILSLWRSQVDITKPCEVWCKKSRYDEIATVGMVKVGFHPPSGRYYDLDANEENGLWHPKTFVERMREQEEAFADNEEAFAEIAAGDEA